MTDHLDRGRISLLVDRLDQIVDWVHDELENAITCQVAFTDKTWLASPPTAKPHSPQRTRQRLRPRTPRHPAIVDELRCHRANACPGPATDAHPTSRAGSPATSTTSRHRPGRRSLHRDPRRLRQRTPHHRPPRPEDPHHRRRTTSRGTRIELNAKACATGPHDGRRLPRTHQTPSPHLIDAHAVTPLRHVTAGRWQSPSSDSATSRRPPRPPNKRNRLNCNGHHMC